MIIEKLQTSDIPDLIQLSSSIGWGYTADNWETFFHLGRVIGHKAADGELASCAVEIAHSPRLSWLTSFIVSPHHRRQGLARELWHHLKNQTHQNPVTYGLISTEEGLPFYQSLGFQKQRAVYKFTRSCGKDLKLSENQFPLVPISNDDLETLAILDAKGFGVSREKLIKSKLQNHLKAYKLISAQSEVTGFAIAINEGGWLCIGPVVAANSDQALDLIIGCSEGSPNPVRLDLTSDDKHLHQELIQRGFQLEREPPVMSFGDQLPQWSSQYFAIAAQAFG